MTEENFQVDPKRFTDIIDADSLETAVYIAVGAASVCWESMSGTGVFQDGRAKEIGDELIQYIENNYEERPHA